MSEDTGKNDGEGDVYSGGDSEPDFQAHSYGGGDEREAATGGDEREAATGGDERGAYIGD